MSGKYEKPKKKSSGRRRKNKKGFVLLVALMVLGLLITAGIAMNSDGGSARQPQTPDAPLQPQETDTPAEPTQEPSNPWQSEETAVPAVGTPGLRNKGLEIVKIGSYTGMYMEDGTDEILSGILMLKVINNGTEPIQYAKIKLPVGEEIAEFSLTTLKPGAQVVLLEKNRMQYSADVNYDSAEATFENVAVFREPMSLHEDKLRIQILDGAINVTNISDTDITGEVAIYYKNAADGIYYGGITYTIRLENGLKAGEIRQLMASHFSESGSEILFVTIA